MKNIAISGIAPYETGGTANVVKYLEPVFRDYGIDFIYYNEKINYIERSERFPEDRKKRISEKYKKLFDKKVKSIKNSRIFVFHPQSLGFDKLYSLLDNNNEVCLYVLDNSFFCIMSYNHKAGMMSECLHCIGNAKKCPEECIPFPRPADKNDNIANLLRLKNESPKITFLCQNIGQSKLIKKHFGVDVKFEVIGMKTPEFDFNLPVPDKTDKNGFDVVYHGSWVEAKGALYVMELAKHLNSVSFMIPYPKDLFKIKFPGIVIPENIQFKPILWDTGLKNDVENCKLVLCPSFWSAPVEGALIKSFIHNGNVAVYNTKYGFHRELPDQIVMRLNDDIPQSAQMIQENLKCYDNNYEEKISFLRKYFTRNDPRHFFKKMSTCHENN